MTVVLPAPVASFRASRSSSGFDCSFADCRWSRKRRPIADLGATSVSQIAASTASTWQKKGRMPSVEWCRQWRSRRAVSGVTCHWFGGSSRHASTIRRRSLMIGVGSYCWTVGLELLRLLVEDELSLAALLPRSGNRRDQRDASPFVENAIRGLTVLVQLPVAARILVGRVQDWLEEECIHRVVVDIRLRPGDKPGCIRVGCDRPFEVEDHRLLRSADRAATTGMDRPDGRRSRSRRVSGGSVGSSMADSSWTDGTNLATLQEWEVMSIVSPARTSAR